MDFLAGLDEQVGEIFIKGIFGDCWVAIREGTVTTDDAVEFIWLCPLAKRIEGIEAKFFGRVSSDCVVGDAGGGFWGAEVEVCIDGTFDEAFVFDPLSCGERAGEGRYRLWNAPVIMNRSSGFGDNLFGSGVEKMPHFGVSASAESDNCDFLEQFGLLAG